MVYYESCMRILYNHDPGGKIRNLTYDHDAYIVSAATGMLAVREWYYRGIFHIIGSARDVRRFSLSRIQ